MNTVFILPYTQGLDNDLWEMATIYVPLLIVSHRLRNNNEVYSTVFNIIKNL